MSNRFDIDEAVLTRRLAELAAAAADRSRAATRAAIATNRQQLAASVERIESLALRIRAQDPGRWDVAAADRHHDDQDADDGDVDRHHDHPTKRRRLTSKTTLTTTLTTTTATQTTTTMVDAEVQTTFMPMTPR